MKAEEGGMAITITEALAEVKTIKARVAKRQETLGQYVIRDARLRDPLEGEGGSVEFVRRERQAIQDLQERVVAIRTAIQHANLTTSVTIQGATRTVTAWLNWRRDVSAEQKGLLTQLATGIARARQQNAAKGGRTTDDASTAAPGDLIVTISERQLAEDSERMEAILGELDGKLSLINATVTIDV
jgi:hypothetical protein